MGAHQVLQLAERLLVALRRARGVVHVQVEDVQRFQPALRDELARVGRHQVRADPADDLDVRVRRLHRAVETSSSLR